MAQFSLYVHKGGLKPDSFHLQSTDRQQGDSATSSHRPPVVLITTGERVFPPLAENFGKVDVI